MTEAPPPPPASTAVSAAAVSAQGTAARGAAPAASRLVWVALVVLGVVAAASLVLAWRADQRGASLEQELVRRQQESAAQSTEARMLARQAQQGMTDAAAKVALLEARVAEVAVQRTQLEELIQSMSRSRDENLLVDLEAAIRVALQQAAITGSAEPLVATLKQGDERLARYNQPRLEGVRRAIARDLDRVKALSVADMSSLAIKLDEATRMIDELPLVNQAYARKDESRSMAGVAAKAASTPGPTASTPAAWAGRVGLLWGDAADKVWGDVKSLVRVSRIDHPDAMLLAPEQSFFLRESVKLRLLNARLALLSRQFDTAQSDLVVVQTSLDRYFDRSAKRTQLASDLVKQVAGQARQVVVPRPDDTLAALTAAAGR